MEYAVLVIFGLMGGIAGTGALMLQVNFGGEQMPPASEPTNNAVTPRRLHWVTAQLFSGALTGLAIALIAYPHGEGLGACLGYAFFSGFGSKILSRMVKTFPG